ncbi:MAG: iron-containing alcohol dehydrogenase [Lachnospiraceae bacterium]|nr:iron-containing alcohol dehydrogenase [Lachnospiraceae bacterium]
MEFTFYTANKIVFKQGALKELSEHIGNLGKKFLVVIDPFFAEGPAMTTLADQIKAVGAEYIVFSEICGEPTVDLVDEVSQLAIENKCDAVISLGGGSSIDIGKATAAIITNGGPSIDYLEVVGKGKKVVNEPVPFVSIPTTAGTGSEVTKNAVLGSKTQVFKRSMRDDKMVATIAVIDPELNLGCPKKVTATAGIDAMTHLIEAYTTFRATPISDALALRGIELAGKYLQRAYENGNDIEAREGMCAAALLGGMAFANSGLGAAHGFGMAVGIKYHLPHGEACGISLPHVVRLNAKACPEKMDKLGEALTGKRFVNPGEGTQAAIDFLFDLNKAIGIEPDYKYLNIPVEEVAEVALGSRGTSMTSNPVQLNDEELIAFAKEIM